MVAISLNTGGYSEEEAKAVIARTDRESGLPTTGPVRFGAGVLLESIGFAPNQ